MLTLWLWVTRIRIIAKTRTVLSSPSGFKQSRLQIRPQLPWRKSKCLVWNNVVIHAANGAEHENGHLPSRRGNVYNGVPIASHFRSSTRQDDKTRIVFLLLFIFFNINKHCCIQSEFHTANCRSFYTADSFACSHSILTRQHGGGSRQRKSNFFILFYASEMIDYSSKHGN